MLLPIHHEHRVRKGVDRGLAGLLRPDQLRLVRLPIVAKLVRHRVEGGGQLPQFIFGVDGNKLVQIARAYRRGRLGHGAYRLQDRADRAGHQEHGQGDSNGQSAAVPDQRRAGHLQRALLGAIHIFLVDPQDLGRNGLDLVKSVVQARLLLSAKVELAGRLGGVPEEFVALGAVTIGQPGEALDQFSFPRQSDVVLLDEQTGSIAIPVQLVLLARLLLSSGQGELKGRVDPIQRLVEIAHGGHAGVVLAENLADAVAETVDEHGCGAPDHHQQGEQRHHRKDDPAAKSHGLFLPYSSRSA